jgi:hypothetical protein
MREKEKVSQALILLPLNLSAYQKTRICIFQTYLVQRKVGLQRQQRQKQQSDLVVTVTKIEISMTLIRCWT